MIRTMIVAAALAALAAPAGAATHPPLSDPAVIASMEAELSAESPWPGLPMTGN